MAFRFCEMPFSGKTQVLGTSNLERSYVDQHLWEQLVGFLYHDSLPEDTKRPIKQLPRRNQEGPPGPCFSNPTVRKRSFL